MGLKRNTEIGFLLILFFVALFGASLLMYKFALVGIFLLTLSPLVALWLWKFYQLAFTNAEHDSLMQWSIGVVVWCAIFFVANHAHHEAVIDEALLKGHTRSKMVTEEGLENSAMVTERRYFFYLDNKNDHGRKKL